MTAEGFQLLDPLPVGQLVQAMFSVLVSKGGGGLQARVQGATRGHRPDGTALFTPSTAAATWLGTSAREGSLCRTAVTPHLVTVAEK